ncbi:MAG: NIPSNAP family protein, partial [Planctomycetota bacterium]
VFFGETLVGTKIPNLTYMLVFENDDARKANWKKFVSSPGWNKLKRMPIYRETVSGITNIFLKATPYSQL